MNDFVAPIGLPNASLHEASNQFQYLVQQLLVGSAVAILSTPHELRESLVEIRGQGLPRLMQLGERFGYFRSCFFSACNRNPSFCAVAETMTIGKPIARLRKSVAVEGWALLLLRVLVGFGFMAHGYAKLERGPEKFAAILAAMGVPAPAPTAWATTLLEFLGGLSILLGAYVVPLAVPLSVVMATAMFSVHFRYGFSSIRLKAITASGAEFGPVGYELNLFYIAALAMLAFSGPSFLSLDRWRAARSTSRTTSALSLPGAKP